MRISHDGVVLDTSASTNTYRLSNAHTGAARRAIESPSAAAARSKTSTFRVDVREDTIVSRDGGGGGVRLRASLDDVPRGE